MKEFIFTIYLRGRGNNADEAWKYATEGLNLNEASTPDKDQIRESTEREVKDEN